MNTNIFVNVSKNNPTRQILSPLMSRWGKQVGMLLVLAAGGCRCHTPPPPLSLTPKSWCDHIKPTLLENHLDCTGIAGNYRLGSFGPDEHPWLRTLQGELGSDLPLAEADVEFPSFHERFRFDANGHVGAPLQATLPWLPNINVSGEGHAEVSVEVNVTSAKLKAITDLGKTLLGKSRESVASCLTALCDQNTNVVDVVLEGYPSIVLSSSSSLSIDSNTGWKGIGLTWNTTAQKGKSVSLVRSTKAGPVSFGFARHKLAAMLATQGLCKPCGEKSQPCCPKNSCFGNLSCEQGVCDVPIASKCDASCGLCTNVQGKPTCVRCAKKVRDFAQNGVISNRNPDARKALEITCSGMVPNHPVTVLATGTFGTGHNLDEFNGGWKAWIQYGLAVPTQTAEQNSQPPDFFGAFASHPVSISAKTDDSGTIKAEVNWAFCQHFIGAGGDAHQIYECPILFKPDFQIVVVDAQNVPPVSN